MKERNAKSENAGLRKRSQAKIDSGYLKESDDLPSAFKILHFDSLGTVELIMSFEESAQQGVEVEPLSDVRDLLRLLKTLDFQNWRKNREKE